MKKLISLIIILIGFAFTLSAQTYGTADNNGISIQGGTAGTTTSVNAYGATAVTYTWSVPVSAAYYYNATVRLADVSAGSTANTASVLFQGSNDGTYFSTITSRTYSAGGTDTVICFQNSTPYPNFKFLRISVTPSDSIKIDRKLLKVSPIYW